MKITARLTGTATLARVDAVRLRIVQRVTAAIEREAQSSGSPSPRLRGEGRGEGQPIPAAVSGRPSP